MSVIESRGLTKVYRTYRKESGLRGSIKGLVWRKHDETRAADNVSSSILSIRVRGRMRAKVSRIAHRIGASI